MKLFKGLPLYQATVVDEIDGIFNISLVENPATQSDFVLFSQEEMFSIQDEEKKVISGAVMLADTPIYRTYPTECYIVYSKDTILRMSERMFQEGTYKEICLNHDNRPIQGVDLLEMFIKDSSKGVNPSYLSNIPEGSLIATYKINDEKLWNIIKEKQFKGFSLAGYFTMEPEKTDLDEVLDLIAQVKSKYNIK